MASEIRANKQTNRAGLGTVTYTDTGIIVSGIVTATSIDASVTGDFSIADKIVHTGDTNTAIRFPSADKISFETGGTSRVSIANTGVILDDELYINQTSAGTPLRIEGMLGSTENILFKNNTSGGHIQFGFRQNDSDGNHHRAYITCSKGTNNVSGKLEIKVRGSGGGTNRGFILDAGVGIQANQTFLPETDSAYDLGTNTVRWAKVYADTLYGDGSNLTGITGTTINNNANNRIITGSGTANTLEGESTLTYNGTQLHVNGGAGSNVQVDGTGSYGQFSLVKVWMGLNSRSHNTAVGNGALASATGGQDCTAVGHNALNNSTSGSANTVLGSHAMIGTVTGSNNVAVGHGALNKLTSGYNNTAVGRLAALENLGGHNNTFLGLEAGTNNTSGSNNIYGGSGAGKYESTSNDNVAIGWNCFGGERSGGNSNSFNKNVCIGHQALAQQRISNGDGENVCIGYRAMYNTTTSSWRTVVIGFEAGYNNNGGSYNTFVGTFAGKNYTSGGNTMCLGYNAGTANSPSGNLTNQQDVICLGNNVTSQLYCNDTSISSSDSRDKTDITEWTHGLSFINQLKPITYRWDKRTWYGTDEEPIGTPDGSKKKAKLHLGFLAQDALAVEQSFGYASKKDDMLAVNLNEDGTAYGMKYERLVVPLTKAVQELSAEIDKLKAEIAVLKGS